MADLQQILAGTSLTITETFLLDGVPSNIDAALPTLTLYKPDGTAYTPVPTVLNSWAGPPARTTGEYRFILPRQITPYKLKYHLDGTIGGQPQTLKGWVEWIGASLFIIDAFRKVRIANGTPFAATGVSPIYTNDQIQDTRAAVLDELESILGFPPVPRYTQETHSANGGGLVLRKREPLELISVSVAGTSQLLSGYYLHPAGIVRPVTNYAAGPTIPSGVGNVTVEYVHGWDRAIGLCSNIAMAWVAKELNPSAFSSATTISTPDGATYTYERRGGFTGVAELDRWLERHRAVAGVA